MVIKNIFTKKTKKEKEIKVKKEEKPEESGPPLPLEEKKIEKKEISPEGKHVSQAWKVLKAPHITEKAADFTKQNKYVFQVDPKTNKIEIKKAVEDLYRINVLGVRIVNIPMKKRRLGRIAGWKKGYKKAIVTIKKGQKIELLPR